MFFGSRLQCLLRPARWTASLALLAPLALSGCQRDDLRPNVLWISLDTLRSDHLSCYGYERETSPTIDRLAREGALFENCYATTSWTLPSHVSMLTGLCVSAHGVCDHQLAGALDGSFELHGTFVSETLREARYETAGFYTWKYLEPQFGFGPGFETWERTAHTVNSHPDVRERWREARAAKDGPAIRALMEEYPELFERGRKSARESVDRAVGWLRDQRAQERKRPFFLFLHLFDIHDPYTAPAPFARKFDPEYDGPIDGQRISGNDSLVGPTMPDRDFEHLVARYDGGIAWTDFQIGRLLVELDTLEIADNTLVLLTSDHGEEFFEHGRKLHRASLYRESLAVPLVLRMPGRIPAGARIETPVSLIDLVPTVHELLGLEAPAAVSGVSLVDTWAEGADPLAAPFDDRALLAELLVLPEDGGPAQWTTSVHRGDRHTIVYDPGSDGARFEVFDLSSNPWEEGFGDLFPADSATAAGALRELGELAHEIRDLRGRLPSRRVRVELTEEDREELKALGYTSSEHAAGASERLCLEGCVWRQD